MNCLKCGKKTGKTEAFCQECMEVMERYPVKPGTVAQIPNRNAIQAERKAQQLKHEPTPAEQLLRLLIFQHLQLGGIDSGQLHFMLHLPIPFVIL